MNMDLFNNSTNATNDQMYGCNGEVSRTDVKSESVFMCIFMFIIILVSIFGNTLVTSAIYQFRNLRQAGYILLCSLAISDFLSPILRLLSIGIATLKGKWIFGCQWCYISSAIGVFFCAASIVHLCFVTMERFLFIRYPMRHDTLLTKRRLTCVIIFIWCLSLFVALIPYFGQSVDMTFNKNMLICEFYLARHPYLSLLLLGLYFGLPLALMIIVYYHISRTAILQTRKIRYNSVGDRKVKRKRIFLQNWKTVKIVFIVIGMFTLLWSPYFIVNVIKAYSPTLLPYWVERVAFCLAYLNSCCNWIVYSVMNTNVRSAFTKLLRIDERVKSLRESRLLSWRQGDMTTLDLDMTSKVIANGVSDDGILDIMPTSQIDVDVNGCLTSNLYTTSVA